MAGWMSQLAGWLPEYIGNEFIRGDASLLARLDAVFRSGPSAAALLEAALPDAAQRRLLHARNFIARSSLEALRTELAARTGRVTPIEHVTDHRGLLSELDIRLLALPPTVSKADVEPAVAVIARDLVAALLDAERAASPAAAAAAPRNVAAAPAALLAAPAPTRPSPPVAAPRGGAPAPAVPKPPAAATAAATALAAPRRRGRPSAASKAAAAATSASVIIDVEEEEEEEGGAGAGGGGGGGGGEDDGAVEPAAASSPVASVAAASDSASDAGGGGGGGGGARRTSRSNANRKSLNEATLAGEAPPVSRGAGRGGRRGGKRAGGGDGGGGDDGGVDGGKPPRAVAHKCFHCKQPLDAAHLPGALQTAVKQALELHRKAAEEVDDVGLPSCLLDAPHRALLLPYDYSYFEVTHRPALEAAAATAGVDDAALDKAPIVAVQQHESYVRSVAQFLAEHLRSLEAQDKLLANDEGQVVMRLPEDRTTLVAHGYFLFHLRCQHLVPVDACLSYPHMHESLALLAALGAPELELADDAWESSPLTLITDLEDYCIEFPNPQVALMTRDLDVRLALAHPAPLYAPVQLALDVKLALGELVADWLPAHATGSLDDLKHYLDDVPQEDAEAVGLEPTQLSGGLVTALGRDLLHNLSDVDHWADEAAREDGREPRASDAPSRLMNHPAVLQLLLLAPGWTPDGDRRQHMKPLSARARAGGGAGGGLGGRKRTQKQVSRDHQDMPAVATELIGGLMALGFRNQMQGYRPATVASAPAPSHREAPTPTTVAAPAGNAAAGAEGGGAVAAIAPTAAAPPPTPHENLDAYYSDRDEGWVLGRLASSKPVKQPEFAGGEVAGPRLPQLRRVDVAGDGSDDEESVVHELDDEDAGDADDVDAVDPLATSEEDEVAVVPAEQPAKTGRSAAGRPRGRGAGAAAATSARAPAKKRQRSSVATPTGSSPSAPADAGRRTLPSRKARPSNLAESQAEPEDHDDESDDEVVLVSSEEDAAVEPLSSDDNGGGGDDAEGDIDATDYDEGDDDDDDDDGGASDGDVGFKRSTAAGKKRARAAMKRGGARKSSSAAARPRRSVDTAPTSSPSGPSPSLQEDYTVAIAAVNAPPAAAAAASDEGDLPEAAVLELQPATEAIPSWPYADELSGRTYHRAAVLTLTHASGRELRLHVTTGSFVRIALSTAKGAMGSDCNPHAHLPRADAGTLLPGAWGDGLPHTDPMHATYRNHGFGLPLCDGSTAALPPSRFCSGELLAAERRTEHLGKASWLWHSLAVDPAARRDWEATTGNSWAHVHGAARPAFSMLATRAGATPGPFALARLTDNPHALVLPPECAAAGPSTAAAADPSSSASSAGGAGGGSVGRVRTDPGEVLQVTAIWSDAQGVMHFHGQRFMSSLWTVQAHHSHPQALVRTDECATLPLASVLQTVLVHDAAPWSAGMRAWAGGEAAALLKRDAAYYSAYRTAVNAARGAMLALARGGGGAGGDEAMTGAASSSSSSPSPSAALPTERVTSAVAAAIAAAGVGDKFDLTHAVQAAHLPGSTWASGGLPLLDNAAAPSWEWEQAQRFISGHVPVGASALLGSTKAGRAAAVAAAAAAADAAAAEAGARIAAAGGDVSAPASVAAISAARAQALRGHFFVPPFDRAELPIPLYFERDGEVDGLPAAAKSSGAASSSSLPPVAAAAVAAGVRPASLFADSPPLPGSAGWVRRVYSEFFALHHHTALEHNEPWRFESIPAAEAHLARSRSTVPALRLVRVLVPAAALPAAAAGAGSSSSSSGGAAGLPAACPPGFTVAVTVQLFCAACNAKRVAACEAVPRALCAPLRRSTVAGGAPYHSALLHKGRVLAVGGGVYVSPWMGGPHSARHHTAQVRRMTRARVTPAWQFDGVGQRFLHLSRGAQAAPFQDAERILAAARAAELARHANPAEFPEMHRKRLPGSEAAFLPRRHSDYVLPLQVMFVGEIAGLPVASAAVEAAAGSADAAAAAASGPAGVVTPCYRLYGTPLYRPTDTTLPVDDARSYAGNELFWPSKDDYDFGFEHSVQLNAEDTEGACVVVNGSHAGAQPAAVEEAINALAVAPGPWRHVFIVRRCLNVATAIAATTAVPPTPLEASGALLPVASVLAAPAGSELAAAFRGRHGFGPGVMPLLDPARPAAVPLLPVPLPELPRKDVCAHGVGYRLPPGMDPHCARDAFPRPLGGLAPTPPPGGGDGSPIVARTLDLFAGTGGLTEGLHQSGQARTIAAVEFVPDIALAFAANHASSSLAGPPLTPDGLPSMPPTVSCEDINVLTHWLLYHDARTAATADDGGGGPRAPPLPGKGCVDQMTGGPPCQGYSIMNRFGEGGYSVWKRSAFIVFLALVSAQLPRSVLIENVALMSEYGGGRVIQLIARALTELGYQVTVSIVQSGQFGAPQSRNRTIILAALPGYPLPRFPEPLHTFNAAAITPCHAHFGRPLPTSKTALVYPHNVEFGRYGPHGGARSPSAPLPQTFIRDVLVDLPPVSNEGVVTLPDGGGELALVKPDTPVPYVRPPGPHFTRVLRAAAAGRSHHAAAAASVTCHLPRQQTGITAARVAILAPYMAPGVDWRDLRNVAVTDEDGRVLWRAEAYVCADYFMNGRTPDGAPGTKNGREPQQQLGICPCCATPPRDKARRLKPAFHNKPKKNEESIIPWSLPHTGHSNGQWAGLYGVNSEWGYFSTIITTLALIGKNGMFMHPSQPRLITIREAARGQGFPDSYRFPGSIASRYKQIGNAVSPPVGKALGGALLATLRPPQADAARARGAASATARAGAAGSSSAAGSK